jgi:type I restriction enzyme S subunit
MANGELPEGWETTELSALCDYRREIVMPSHLGSKRYVGLEHLDPGRVAIMRWGSDADVRSAKHRFRAGDILYGKLRPYLDKAALAEWEGVCSTDIMVLAPKNAATDATFLALRLHSNDFIGHANATTEGVNHPRTSWSGISKFVFDVPPLPEQRAIARVLSKLQEAVEVQDRIIATLKELKAATLAKLFREGLRGQVETTETAYGEIPAHWSVSRLDQCAEVQTGVAKGRKLNGGHLVERPYLRVANVQDGYLDLREIKVIQLRASEVDRFTLRDGDVLLTEGGDFDKLGRGFIWHEQVKDCVHQNHIFAVRTQHALMLPDFLTYLIQSPYGKAYFLNVAHKTTNLACINSTKLKEFPVLLPPIKEQTEVASSVASIDHCIDAATQKREALNRLFSSLLHLLMTGEVRVTPLMDKAQASKVAELPARYENGALYESVLREIVRRIVAAVSPEKIILFGSAARGEMGPDSDVDLLVVKPNVHRRKTAQALHMRLRGIPVSVDLIVATPEDLERHKDTIGLIYRPALREGKVIYAS